MYNGVYLLHLTPSEVTFPPSQGFRRMYINLVNYKQNITVLIYTVTSVSAGFCSSLRLPQPDLDPSYITSGRTHKKTPFPNNSSGVFTSPLHRNGSSIVVCVFITAGTCLLSRCLAMNVYSGTAIAAFRLHDTILWRTDWLLSSDSVHNSRCYAIGKYTNTRFYATVEVLLESNNGNGAFYVARGEML
jgi:hypothetical protein